MTKLRNWRISAILAEGPQLRQNTFAARLKLNNEPSLPDGWQNHSYSKEHWMRKILVIDDDPNVVKILEKWLNNAGCEVVGAFNGRVGLEKVQSVSPELILCDMMLPDTNGVDIVRRLKLMPETKDIPVIFMTVTMGVEVDHGDETIDIDGCLYRIFAKPLHDRKLLSEIRKSINRRRHHNKFEIQGS
jgi:CheY-like chemotaxis protein